MQPQALLILRQFCRLENWTLWRAPSPREPRALVLWGALTLKEQNLGCPAWGNKHRAQDAAARGWMMRRWRLSIR